MVYDSEIIAIYMYYSANENSYESDLSVVKQLDENSSRLIVVINGNIEKHFLEELKIITNEIIFRDNVGFDAGAYKEILCNYLNHDEISICERLIICNSTFLGFVISLKEIINEMAGKYDLWGLNMVNSGCWSHIQSYFLVFERKLINDCEIYKFFSMIDDKNANLEYVLADFEIGVYDFFNSKGYRCGAYKDLGSLSIYGSPFEAVKMYGLPIIKKKLLCRPELKEDVVKIKEYLREVNPLLYQLFDLYCSSINQKYEPNIKVKRRIDRLDITKEELFTFINDNEAGVHLYGAGIYAKKMNYYLMRRGVVVKGYVVTELSSKDNPYADIRVHRYSDISENDAVIVCMDREKSEDLFLRLKNRKRTLWLWSDMNYEASRL